MMADSNGVEWKDTYSTHECLSLSLGGASLLGYGNNLLDCFVSQVQCL